MKAMSVVGISLLVLAIAGLWLCLPGKSSTPRPFLRGGLDIAAAIVITAGIGIGIIFLVVDIADL
jgi:hypothetical protein